MRVRVLEDNIRGDRVRVREKSRTGDMIKTG
jgi:hypothetical protein